MDELHSSRQVVMNEDRIVYEKIRRSETVSYSWADCEQKVDLIVAELGNTNKKVKIFSYSSNYCSIFTSL